MSALPKRQNAYSASASLRARALNTIPMQNNLPAHIDLGDLQSMRSQQLQFI